MCILMYFGPEAMPIREHLDTAAINNPDGFGWAIVTQSEGILTGHGMDPDEVIEEFIAARYAYPEHSALFHARIATQGSICLDNCHPFTVQNRFIKKAGYGEVTGEMVLAHNGMLPVYPPKGDDRSDTKMFSEDIFMYRFPHLDSRRTKARLETFLGSSKLVVLTTDPAYRQQSYIFNEKLGDWLDHDGSGDIWYSNTSYKTYRYSSKGYSGFDWSYSRAYGTAGKPVVDVEWDDAWMDSETRLACAACQYAIVYCRCIGVVKGVYLPASQVKAPKPSDLFQGSAEEDDETVTWTCLACESVGAIDDDGECSFCGIMFCCNALPEQCVCWDPATKRLRSQREIDAIKARRDAALDEWMEALTSLPALTAGPETVEVRDDDGNLQFTYLKSDDAAPSVS